MSSVPLSSKNNVTIAVAGSGKTTSLVRRALASNEKRILFLTYTVENTKNIRDSFINEAGFVPKNVEIITWFSFLLRDGVRPFHNFVSQGLRVKSINFVTGSSAANAALRYVPETSTERYYFDKNRDIYTDKISHYACKCDDSSGGLVIARLQKIFSSIYIDEVQDLAGWDLEFLKKLFRSNMYIRLVGDPRQVTYLTNHSAKNSKYRGSSIVSFFEELQTKNICTIETSNTSSRCHSAICLWANQIYPELPASTGHSNPTNHDGVFTISRAEVTQYIIDHSPIILRFSSATKTMDLPAKNIGLTKGLTFDRVLIFPTAKMKKFIRTLNPDDAGDRAKFYVAVTRARHSVAFVID
jgi:DNA helicase-2/ATP-dependent DNA helicase PcrA